MKASKWAAIALSAAIMVSSAACAKKTDGGKSAANDNAPDTVTVWTYPVHAKYEDDLKGMIADFTAQHPNIKIQYEMLSYAEGPKKFDVALNAGDPPDLYFHAVSGQFVSTGLSLDLDKYVTKDITDDYLPGVLDMAKIGGKLYGLPLYQYQWAWGGNKRILDEAGIDWKKIQQNGWTWTEFNDAAKKLTKKLPDGSTQYGIVTDGTSTDFIDMVARNNGMVDAVDKDGKLLWSDQKIVDTFKFVQGLINNGYMPKETAAIDPAKRTAMFYDGKAAILSKAIPYYDVMIQNRDKDIDAGKVQGEKINFVYLPVPHADNAKPATTTGAEGYMAFKQKNDKGEQHAKNTFLVMEALSGAKAGNSANELCLPFVRKSQAKEFEGKGLASAQNKTAADAMQKNGVTPIDLALDVDKAAKRSQFVAQVEKPVWQAILSGSMTPDQALDELKSKGKQIMGQ